MVLTGPGTAQASKLRQTLRIDLVCCLGERHAELHTLDVPQGTTVAEALRLLREGGVISHDAHEAVTEVGVWGRKAGFEQILRDGDRLELYRPLRVDPKVARRERFRAQGARGAGLFARRRPNAKPGY